MKSKIMELLQAEDSVAIFDIDGVLAAYEYGEYNHNACRDEDWNEYISNNEVYKEARPLKVLQDFIANKNEENVFVCSVASYDERIKKEAFVIKNYGISRMRIFFVTDKTKKVEAINMIKEMFFPETEDKKFVMVDDTSSVLTNIQENSGYSTAHISSFMK